MFKNKHRKIFVAICSFIMCVILLSGIPAFALERASSLGTNEIPYESYTYWEDFGSANKTPVYCKPMYKIERVITSDTLGIDSIVKLSDIFVDDNKTVYVLDSGTAKIYILNDRYELQNAIKITSTETETIELINASGIFVKEDSIYISDTGNERVIITDLSGVVKNYIYKPESRLVPDSFNFRPIKTVIDSKNYLYIACDGSHYGALVYSPEMEFLGFYGANTVKATATDVLKNIFNKFFSNDIKKGSSVLALPYQFNDIVLGPQDFIYTATGTTGNSQQTAQINVMNPGGKNILNNSDYNFADIRIGRYHKTVYIQDIACLDVDSDGFIYALDRTYGRVFWYDRECNLLSVFGGCMGYGIQNGTFRLADCIALLGNDVIVGDSLKNSITIFSLTDYGQKVRAAQLMTLDDDFEAAETAWLDVIKEDTNSQLAYRGLAESNYSAGNFNDAIKYSKLGSDREIYSKSFSKIRQNFSEKWFSAIFFGIIVLAAVIIYLMVIKKKKNIILIKNERVSTMFSTIVHPFEAFRKIKEKNQGSLVLAVTVLGLFYIVEALSDKFKGFAFNSFNAATYNSFFVFLRTVGLVVLWSLSNWLVCVLLGGIGKFKEIFIVTCYSLLPLLFINTLDIILSNILVPEEYVFMEILRTFCLIYTVFILMVAIIKIHDFTFGRFLGTTFLSILSMLIIVFLLFLMFLLAQQVYGWFYTLFVEIRFR